MQQIIYGTTDREPRRRALITSDTAMPGGIFIVATFQHWRGLNDADWHDEFTVEMDGRGEFSLRVREGSHLWLGGLSDVMEVAKILAYLDTMFQEHDRRCSNGCSAPQVIREVERMACELCGSWHTIYPCEEREMLEGLRKDDPSIDWTPDYYAMAEIRIP